jgi:hypothetical protein
VPRSDYEFSGDWRFAFLLTCAYLWWMNAPGSIAVSKIVAVTVFVLGIFGIVFSLMRSRATNVQFLAIVLRAVLLTVPTWIALSLSALRRSLCSHQLRCSSRVSPVTVAETTFEQPCSAADAA